MTDTIQLISYNNFKKPLWGATGQVCPDINKSFSSQSKCLFYPLPTCFKKLISTKFRFFNGALFSYL